jgi:hypothetical protein
MKTKANFALWDVAAWLAFLMSLAARERFFSRFTGIIPRRR